MHMHMHMNGHTTYGQIAVCLTVMQLTSACSYPVKAICDGYNIEMKYVQLRNVEPPLMISFTENINRVYLLDCQIHQELYSSTSHIVSLIA